MGKMILPMTIQAAGAITNIILDPIMIFGLLGLPAMGVKEAAIAAVIGWILVTSLSLFIFLTRKFDAKLDLRQLHFSWDTIRCALSVGISNACMSALGSILVIGLNSTLIQFLNTAVPVYGICYKLQASVFMSVSDLAQGAMLIMGYNYGAGSHERLLQISKYVIVVTSAIMVCGCAVFLLLLTWLLILFHASEDMLRIDIPALRITSISFLPMALGFILPTLFQTMGLGLQSLIALLLRQLCITLPLSWLFAAWFGLDGMWYSLLIAESIVTGVAVLLFIHIREKGKTLPSTFVQQPSASQEAVH